MKDLDALARLVQALEPWRAHLVLIGGWAHRLYRFHPEGNAPLYQPVATRETDVAFSNEAPLDGDIQAALSEAGFTEELTGEHKPPVRADNESPTPPHDALTRTTPNPKRIIVGSNKRSALHRAPSRTRLCRRPLSRSMADHAGIKLS